MPNEDFVSRQWLIGEYHRRHKGPPGGALKMIEEAPAADVEPKMRWIPVTERLPEEWHMVMSYQPIPSWMKNGLGFIRIAVYIGNGKWREAERHNMMELPVTHWMPLPEPPKEEKDNNDNKNL